jgi:hypothetical protein
MIAQHFRAAVLLAMAGALTVAFATWTFYDVRPYHESMVWVWGAIVAGAGITQILAAGAALHATPFALRIGRWTAMVLGATLIGLLVSAVVAAGRDVLLLQPAIRLSLLLAFGILQLFTAYSARGHFPAAMPRKPTYVG